LSIYRLSAIIEEHDIGIAIPSIRQFVRHTLVMCQNGDTLDVQCESKKIPPCGFLKCFPKRLGIFNQFFILLLYHHFYTRVL